MESKSKFAFEYSAPTMLADKKQNMEHQIHYRRLYLGGRLAVVGCLSLVWARAMVFEAMKLRALPSSTAARVSYLLQVLSVFQDRNFGSFGEGI